MLSKCGTNSNENNESYIPYKTAVRLGAIPKPVVPSQYPVPAFSVPTGSTISCPCKPKVPPSSKPKTAILAAITGYTAVPDSIRGKIRSKHPEIAEFTDIKIYMFTLGWLARKPIAILPIRSKAPSMDNREAIFVLVSLASTKYGGTYIR